MYCNFICGLSDVIIKTFSWSLWCQLQISVMSLQLNCLHVYTHLAYPGDNAIILLWQPACETVFQ